MTPLTEDQKREERTNALVEQLEQVLAEWHLSLGDLTTDICRLIWEPFMVTPTTMRVTNKQLRERVEDILASKVIDYDPDDPEPSIN